MKNRMKNSMFLLMGMIFMGGSAYGMPKPVYNPALVVPVGPYQNSCDINWYTTLFSCNCMDDDGNYAGLASYYDVSKCKPGSIQNVNGQIGCNVIGSNCNGKNGQPCCLLPKLSQTQISAAAAAA